MPLYDLFPWNISSPVAFLALYALVIALVALVLRWRARVMHTRSSKAALPEAGPYRGKPPARMDATRALALAYLRGGNDAVRDAILAMLVAAGVIATADGALTLDRELATHPDVRAHQRAMLASIARGHRIVDAASERARQLEHGHHEMLDREGLMIRPARSKHAIGLGVGAAVFLIVFGLIRMLRGAALHHPVGFLMIEMVVAMFAVSSAYRTRVDTEAGRAHLEALSVEALPHATRARGSKTPTVLDAAVASAVFGLAVGPAFVNAAIAQSYTVGVHGSDGGGSCGGGGCGGGGCGGCGGGGCGG